MTNLSKGKKRKKTHDAGDRESVLEQETLLKQSAPSRLRDARKRLQRLQQKTAALEEQELALERKVQDADDTLFKAALDQLRGGPAKSKSWRWDHLVVLTARWRYAAAAPPASAAADGDSDNDGPSSIGPCADLKKGLSFPASLRLARNVSWAQWRGHRQEPEPHQAGARGLLRDLPARAGR